MTKQQKRKTREILRLYAAAEAGRAQMAAPARAAARAAVQAVEREGGAKAKLLKMRYLEGRRVHQVIEALYIGATTYNKLDIEAISTAAIVMAEHGCKIS